MENLNNDLEKSIDSLISTIINSNEYKKCIELKEKMNTNKELTKLISEVKILQKKYIKSNYDEVIKQELEEKESKLNQIPIYSIYNDNLKVVNETLEVVNDSLNNYFYKKLNPNINCDK